MPTGSATDIILLCGVSEQAELPIEMRPVLAPSRRNKIPMSVRQVCIIFEHVEVDGLFVFDI